MPNTYDMGDSVRLSAAFTDGGTATDPGTILFRWKPPKSSASLYTYGSDAALVKASTGNYYVDLTIPGTASSAGQWTYRFEGTGAVIAADEDRFYVEPSPFYTT